MYHKRTTESVPTGAVKFQKRVNRLFSLQIFTMCLLCQEVSVQRQKKDTVAALRNYLPESTQGPPTPGPLQQHLCQDRAEALPHGPGSVGPSHP